MVRGRVRDAGTIMVEICDELEPVLQAITYLEQAPFRTVSLIIRFGSKRNSVLEYGPLDRKHSELPVAVELEMRALARMSRDDIKKEFLNVTVSALVDVAQRYGLPYEPLVQKLGRRGMNDGSVVQ